uniref:Uncharacterized protein n=1 Tax=Rhizophora mucronata TaxID=61149 RepID=A0A2P2Q2F7_RHIMU
MVGQMGPKLLYQDAMLVPCSLH